MLRIDTTSAVPAYAQIVRQVKRAVALGVLRAGQGLPSLRETAVRLRVNPMTVSKAYKQLEAEGILESRQGSGSYVSPKAAQLLASFHRDGLAGEIDQVITDARNLGISTQDLKQLIDQRIANAQSQEDHTNG
jgi:GntR family transcriptional regulator